MRRVPHAAAAAALIALAGAAAAADGRKEISQVGIVAAGGFPYVISEPGSYVLTSDLAVPDTAIALRIDTDDVNIDLNGFAIRGTMVCVPSDCPAFSSSAGISVPASPTTNGRRCSVRNGSILGIRGSGIYLRDAAYVDGVLVSNAALYGVAAGPHSLVTRSRVTSVGRAALALGDGSGYADDVLGATGLGGLINVSVIGGAATGGNVCDDGRCARGRRYYLSQTPVTGAAASTACDPGFHMASRFEIEEVGTLRYDTLRGAGGNADQGSGPPNYVYGWIRTGFVAENGSVDADPGAANCGGYSSTAGIGTIAVLDFSWTEVPTALPWRFTTSACSGTRLVWCVED